LPWLAFSACACFVVGLTFALMRQGNSEVPPELRVGPLAGPAHGARGIRAMILLFAVIQPFEAFWLGPDRLGRAAAAACRCC
jgi:hypothetical protein